MIFNMLKKTMILILVFVALGLIMLMIPLRQDYLPVDITKLSKPLAWDTTGRYTIHYLEQDSEQIDSIYLLRDNQKNTARYLHGESYKTFGGFRYLFDNNGNLLVYDNCTFIKYNLTTWAQKMVVKEFSGGSQETLPYQLIGVNYNHELEQYLFFYKENIWSSSHREQSPIYYTVYDKKFRVVRAGKLDFTQNITDTPPSLQFFDSQNLYFIYGGGIGQFSLDSGNTIMPIDKFPIYNTTSQIMPQYEAVGLAYDIERQLFLVIYYQNLTTSDSISMWIDVYDKNYRIQKSIMAHDNTYPYTLQMSLENGSVKLRIYNSDAEHFIVKSISYTY